MTDFDFKNIEGAYNPEKHCCFCGKNGGSKTYVLHFNYKYKTKVHASCLQCFFDSTADVVKWCEQNAIYNKPTGPGILGRKLIGFKNQKNHASTKNEQMSSTVAIHPGRDTNGKNKSRGRDSSLPQKQERAGNTFLGKLPHSNRQTNERNNELSHFRETKRNLNELVGVKA